MLSLVHLIYMAGDKCMRQNACFTYINILYFYKDTVKMNANSFFFYIFSKAQLLVRQAMGGLDIPVFEITYDNDLCVYREGDQVEGIVRIVNTEQVKYKGTDSTEKQASHNITYRSTSVLIACNVHPM